jgi:hypothetical protein
MRGGMQSGRAGSFHRPENFKLNTSDFFHPLPLEGQFQGGFRYGFTGARPLLVQDFPVVPLLPT